MTAENEGLIKAAKGTGIIAAQSFVNAIIGVLLFMFMARFLTQTEMGVYGASRIITTAAGMVGLLGLDYAVTRYVPLLKAKGDDLKAASTAKRILIISVSTASITTATLFILAQPLAEVALGSQGYVAFFQVVALATFLAVMESMALGFLQALQKFARLAWARFAAQIARMVLTVVLLIIGLGVTGVVLGWMLFSVVVVSFATPVVWRQLFRQDPGQGAPREAIPLKELLNFSLPLMGVYTLAYATNSIDQLIVLCFLGVDILGVYVVVMNAAAVISTIFGLPLMMTLTPSMSETHGQQGIEGVSDALRMSSRYISLLFVPASLVLAALSPLALFILGGAVYVDGTLPLALICIGMSTYGFSVAITSALIAIGKTRVVLAILAVASAVELIGSLSISAFYALSGVALGRALMYLTMLLLLIYLGSRHLRVSFDRRALKGSAAASGLTAIALYSLAAYSEFELVLLPLYLITAFIVYTFTLFGMRILTLADLAFFFRITPGGVKLYYKISNLVKTSPTLTSIAQKLLAE
ncbi:MAG: oligosaccharide flippase family protein [Candidatus Bathyarchaeia archaeon]